MINLQNDSKTIYNYLVDFANDNQLVTYSDVADVLGLDMDDHFPTMNIIEKILGDINREIVAEKLPMITAIVILKNSKPKTCGQGFFNLAMNLGHWNPYKVKADIFWANTIKEIFKTKWVKI